MKLNLNKLKFSKPVEVFYKEWEGAVQLLVLILFPLVVYLYGIHLSSSVERSKLKLQYVNTAIGILSEEVKEDGSDTIMREWAVSVLDLYSPVEMSDAQKKSLALGNTRLSVSYIPNSYSFETYTPNPRSIDMNFGEPVYDTHTMGSDESGKSISNITPIPEPSEE